MLYKTLFILTLVAVFAGALFSTAVPPPPQPFNPNTPVFINPYTQTGFIANLGLVGPAIYQNISTTHNDTNSPNNGCSNLTIWNCVNEIKEDFNDTYYSLTWNTTHPALLSQIGLASNQWANIQNFTLDIWCRWRGTIANISDINATKIEIGIAYYNGGPLTSTLVYGADYSGCLNSNKFSHLNLSRLTGYSWFPPTYSTANMFLEINIPGRELSIGHNAYLDISTVKISGYFQQSQGCNSSDWWANAVCGAFNFPIIGDLIRFLTFVFDLLGYVVGWIGFAVQILANYLSIIIWLYNIPGMPTVIQGYVDAVLTTWIAVLSIEIYKLIKPFAGSG